MNKFLNSLYLSLLVVLAFFSCTTNLKAANPVLDVRWVTISNGGSITGVGSHALGMQLQIHCNSDSGTATAHKFHDVDFYWDYNPDSLTFAGNTGGGSTGTSGTDYVWQTGFGPSAGGGTTYAASSTVTDYGSGSGTVSNTDLMEVNLDPFNASVTTTGTQVNGGGWIPVINIYYKITGTHGSVAFEWDNFTSGSTLTAMYDAYPAGFPVNYDEGTGWGTTTTISPLPVTLTDFSAFIEHGVTQLNWATASEINNNYFTMQRSADGLHFTDLFTVQGNGTTNEAHKYVGYDEQPLPGLSYYRLTQTDFNGALHIYNIIEVNNLSIGQFAISSVSPTAFTDQTTMYYKMPTEAPVRLVVTNLSGKIVEDIMVQGQQGDNTYAFNNTSGWQPGVYLATLYYEDKVAYSKMVKN